MNRRVGISALVFGALLVFSMVFFVPQMASANPPEDLKLSIVIEDGVKVLSVYINHPSDNPMVEFIKSVEVTVNGSSYATFTYNRQPRKAKFRYIYEVPLESGYTIEVTADSSMYGSKTAKLIVP